MKAGFVILGARELERKLLMLPKNMQRRVIRKAVRAAQKPLLNRAKANARAISRAGRMGPLIAKNIVLKTPRKQKAGQYAINVQMRPKVSAFWHISENGRDYYIPANIEYGHGPDKTSSARPFMRPAADAVRNEAIRILQKELRIGLLREAILARYL